MAARRWIDEQNAQLSGRLIGSNTKHAANPTTIELGDPGVLPFRIVFRCIVSNDSRDQRLEAGIPTELLGVHLPVCHDYPTQVARCAQRPNLHHGYSLTETTVSVNLDQWKLNV